MKKNAEVEPTQTDRAWEIAEGVAKQWAEAASQWKPSEKDTPDYYVGNNGEKMDSAEGADRETYVITTIWNSDGFDHLRDEIEKEIKSELGEEAYDEWELNYDPYDLISRYLESPYSVDINDEWAEGYIVYDKFLGGGEDEVESEPAPESEPETKGASMERQADYQGWPNYETWSVALWLDNDEGTQELMREYTQNFLEAHKGEEKREGAYSGAVVELADQIKSFIEDGVPELDNSVYSDLLNGALEDVEYRVIAENYLENYEQQ